MRNWLVAAAVLAGFFLPSQPFRAGETSSPVPKVEENEKAFHARLLRIAQEYPRYGRVDDRMNWSPAMCAMPAPTVARLSASDDEATHGRKLYFLFASDRVSYLSVPLADDQRTSKENPVGLAIVKEAWIPEQVPNTTSTGVVRQGRAFGKGFVLDSDRLYRAKEKAALFIMLKLDPQTPGTDQGWVYGTVTPDGKTVTSAGRVQSCMRCHQDATQDRLFGLKHNGKIP